MALYDLCAAFKDFIVNNSMALWCWNAKGQDGFESWFTDASQPDKLIDFSNLGAISGGSYEPKGGSGG